MSSNVSWFQSSRKTTTNGTSLGIKPSPMKVSLINSIDETNRRQRYASQPKSEIISESTQNKLHAYKIDWADINITTAEAMKYPNFTKIKRTQQSILDFLANQFTPNDIKLAFAGLIGKFCGNTQALFYHLPKQKPKLIESFLELVYDENSMMVNTTIHHT
jgi:hypothetical protein